MKRLEQAILKERDSEIEGLEKLKEFKSKQKWIYDYSRHTSSVEHT